MTKLNWDIPDEPMSYREVFQDSVDRARKKQEEYPEDSIVYQQYQIWIDVGLSMMEKLVD